MTVQLDSRRRLIGVVTLFAAFPAALRAYVDRFSLGEIREIQSAHYMEAAIPQVVADETAAILALVEGSQ